MKDKELRVMYKYFVEDSTRFNKEVLDTIKLVDDKFKNLVECEKCGCLLYRSSAIRGKSEVRERYTTATAIYYKMPPEEYIHTPYFCKVHQPKK